MGALWMSRQDVVDCLTEIAAYKAGVDLSEEELPAYVKDTALESLLAPDGRGGGRIRSEELEAAVVTLLYRLGNTPSPVAIPITIELYHKYKNDAGDLEIYEGVQKLYLELLPRMMAKARASGTKLLDPGETMARVAHEFGAKGLTMIMEFFDGLNRDLHRSSWGGIRSVEWRDTVDLSDLFESENLEPMHGTFFDQRFIDWLHRNFERIGDIHWRKFEGLAGEYFEREGFHVVMGPGRGDGGVDLRVFPDEGAVDRPPLILVQCKRQKAKIDQTLVKSVYADVQYERAESGLIVTTSSLQPGAENVRTARGYNVEAADRTTLRSWIDGMKSGR